MTKSEFLDALRRRLSGLPRQEVEDRLAFWGEMIEDRRDAGLSEEDAVRDIGSVDEIAAQIIAEVPLAKIARERVKSQRRLRTWEIVLLVLGSPIWFSLAIAAFSVILSLYAVLWSLVISIWAVLASFAACAVGGSIAGIVFIGVGEVPAGVFLLGAGIVCAGLAILFVFGCKAATRGALFLTRAVVLGIKKCFVGREREV